MNRTILGMLRTLSKEHKKNWKSHINQVVHAYNCTRNESTGYAPFYLLFGRRPRLPVDVMFGLNRNSDCKYVQEWTNGMKEAYEIAAQNARKAGLKNKKAYDKCLRSSVLLMGDRVLVRNLTERGGPGKLRSFWEDKVYVVTRTFTDSPVYEVQPESGEGRKRVLHRNLLFQCDYLPLEGESKKKKLLSRKTRNRQYSRYTDRGQSDSEAEKKESSSSENWFSMLNPEAPPFRPAQDKRPEMHLPEEANATENVTRGEETPDSGDRDKAVETKSSSGEAPDKERSDPYESAVDEAQSNHSQGSDRQISDDDQEETSDGSETTSDEEVKGPRNRRVPMKLTYNKMGQPSYSANWM